MGTDGGLLGTEGGEEAVVLVVVGREPTVPVTGRVVAEAEVVVVVFAVDLVDVVFAEGVVACCCCCCFSFHAGILELAADDTVAEELDVDEEEEEVILFVDCCCFSFQAGTAALPEVAAGEEFVVVVLLVVDEAVAVLDVVEADCCCICFNFQAGILLAVFVLLDVVTEVEPVTDVDEVVDDEFVVVVFDCCC